MIRTVEDILTNFESCFRRKAAFKWFVLIIIGLIIRWDTYGVSSFVRHLALEPGHYYNLLHFFHASSWNIEVIIKIWLYTIQTYCQPIKIDGYHVLIGDGIKVSKEGKKMPGVKKMHQQSNNSNKPPYIYGHHFGVMAMLVGNAAKAFALPIIAEIHEGTKTLRKIQGKQTPVVNGEEKITIVTLMLNMVINIVKKIEQPSLLVLDAYFAVGNTFIMAQELNEKYGKPLLHIITKAKSNAVAYLENPKNNKDKENKIKLYDLFSLRAHDFTSKKLVLYGGKRTVAYLVWDLFWEPIGKKLRFVLVKDGNDNFVLMSSNLSLSPENIILAYSYRFKIEVTFKGLKQLLGAFAYRFWTSALPKLKTKLNLEELTAEEKRLIANTLNAIEGFVNFGCITLGILQILALNYSQSIWSEYTGWIRTKTSSTPSEEIVQNVIRSKYFYNHQDFNNSLISEIIKSKQRKDLYIYEQDVA